MKTIFTFILFISSFYLFSQDRIPAELNEVQINLNILEPSVMLEKRLTDKQSLTLALGFNTISGKDAVDDVKFGLSPSLRASYRNYYPRKKVKKELRPNSGNYIGLVAGYNFGTIAGSKDVGKYSQENAFFLGPVWGIQRNYKSGIHLGLSFGGGFITGSNTDFDFTGVGSFELGFVINSKS